MIVKIVSDAAIRYTAELSARRHPSTGLTQAEWNYHDALEHLQDKEWPEAHCIVRGVQDYVYVICDLSHVGRNKLESKVVAVHRDYIAHRRDDGHAWHAPVNTRHIQHKLFLEKEGMLTVTMLTPWVDGFCAFTPFNRKM